jgi:hypothetical protein
VPREGYLTKVSMKKSSGQNPNCQFRTGTGGIGGFLPGILF